MSFVLGDLTYAVIGAAMEVHSQLGSGYLESVYENCLAYELEAVGFDLERQQPIEVRYKGMLAGRFIADLVVNDVLIVELKAVRQIHERHAAQVLNYLVSTGLEVGLLINFGAASLQHRRLIHQNAKKSTRPAKRLTNPQNPR